MRTDAWTDEQLDVLRKYVPAIDALFERVATEARAVGPARTVGAVEWKRANMKRPETKGGSRV